MTDLAEKTASPPAKTPPKIMVTLNEAAALIGVSTDTIRRYCKAGVLEKVKTSYGPRVERESVLAIGGQRKVREHPKLIAGAIHARAFELLDEGKNFRDLVRELRITADEAIRIAKLHSWQPGQQVPLTPDQEIRVQVANAKLNIEKAHADADLIRARNGTTRALTNASGGRAHKRRG